MPTTSPDEIERAVTRALADRDAQLATETRKHRSKTRSYLRGIILVIVLVFVGATVAANAQSSEDKGQRELDRICAQYDAC